MQRTISALCCFFILCSCELLDNDPAKHVKDNIYVSLEEVARILSYIPLEQTHMTEVHNAVTSSSDNGYDEEYTMKDLFTSPGAGVGDEGLAKGDACYGQALRDLISEYVHSSDMTRSSSSEIGADAFLKALEDSDIQIYWPFSEKWPGNEYPVITFDPEDGSEVNMGYMISCDENGFRHVEEVLVDEEMAQKHAVWVVNRNVDAAYTSLEMLRRSDPDWGEGGGNLIIRPTEISFGTKAALRTLILKEFTMKRQYDSWFAGASEFFVKIGAVEDFTASTEAELRLYQPAVTDFMIVVRRNQLGIPQPFNAVLVSEWTEQLTHCAFMITEDDGGSLEKWNCSAVVKVNSKSYGFDISIPFNRRDDIVWRGQLSGKWIEANSNIVGHFGDVDLTFEVLEQ